MNDLITLGSACRKYRQDVLDKSLSEFCENNVNIKTISAFENGRSSNLKLLTHYTQHLTTTDSPELRETIRAFIKRFIGLADNGN